MSRRQNLLVGYRPAPRRGFLPRVWRRSACASSSSPELRYAALTHDSGFTGATIGERLERLAGRGPPEASGKQSESKHASANPSHNADVSPNSDENRAAWLIQSLAFGRALQDGTLPRV